MCINVLQGRPKRWPEGWGGVGTPALPNSCRRVERCLDCCNGRASLPDHLKVAPAPTNKPGGIAAIAAPGEWLRVACAGRRLTWGPAIAFREEYKLLLAAACLPFCSANRQRCEGKECQTPGLVPRDCRILSSVHEWLCAQSGSEQQSMASMLRPPSRSSPAARHHRPAALLHN